ncbi:hypothetical protein [Rhodococcus sp. PSBB049]|nr:hypothetical protein [Rhodococcus sp. PSBB049]
MAARVLGQHAETFERIVPRLFDGAAVEDAYCYRPKEVKIGGQKE